MHFDTIYPTQAGGSKEKDAQKISLASTSGTLVLHLRGAGDPGKATSNIGTLTFKDLIGQATNEGRNADGLEGIARIRGADGSVQEWAVYNGKLMRRNKTN